MIEDYSFGQMVIGGKDYTSDLIIHSNGSITSEWHRHDSHMVLLSEINDIIEEQPELIIIGTGASGFMEINNSVASTLEKKGIKLYSAPTREAAQYYNEQAKNKKVAAAFHLTC